MNFIAKNHYFIDSVKKSIYILCKKKNIEVKNMSQTTNINIRMDSKLKKEFEEFCQDVGMSMSTAFTLFAKKTVRENQIPFTISREIPNKETLEAIEESEQIAKNPENYKGYNTPKEMIMDILA